MKGIVLLRLFFILVCTAAAYTLGAGSGWSFVLALIGFFVSIFVVIFEAFGRNVSLKGLTSAIFGIILGLGLAWIFSASLRFFNVPEVFASKVKLFVTLIFVYLGLTLGIKGRSEFNLIIPYVTFKRQELKEELVIVDTSSIIDGRILDIVKTGFLEVKLLVPIFIINELRALADSTEHMKRQKGKRGIEILHSLKKELSIEVEIYEADIPGLGSVDEKLLKLAQSLHAKILTTDYNLNRIAQLHGVKVLNINDLANALKPTFIAGERMSIKLIKEGKEHNQAIGYLEDGTMVVVENAKWLIGRTVEVEVTSILQSPSGRIVFTKLIS